MTVTGAELAEPFDALVAAQAAWRWTTLVQSSLTDEVELVERLRKAVDVTRGRRPAGATTSSDDAVELLASVFFDHGSCKAKVVELRDSYPGPLTASQVPQD